MYVCLSVCLFSPYELQFENNFTKFHAQVGTSTEKDRLDFQGHGVKGQGHAATAMEISANPRYLTDFLLNARSEAMVLSRGFISPLGVEPNIRLMRLWRLFLANKRATAVSQYATALQ